MSMRAEKKRTGRPYRPELSDRHTGIGADGLILALDSEHADLRMRMFNADGSEAEMCGNGIRCLVGFALTRGIVPRETSSIVLVETLAGDLEVTPTWEGDKVVWARVSMGEPSVWPWRTSRSRSMTGRW